MAAFFDIAMAHFPSAFRTLRLAWKSINIRIISVLPRSAATCMHVAPELLPLIHISATVKEHLAALQVTCGHCYVEGGSKDFLVNGPLRMWHSGVSEEVQPNTCDAEGWGVRVYVFGGGGGGGEGHGLR